MCLFKKKQINELKNKINKLEEELHQERAEKEQALRKADAVFETLKAEQKLSEKYHQETTALRNVIDRQDELLAKNKKRIKTQQEIINKQNAQLGIEPKRKPRKIEDKDHDPYIEE